MNKNAEQSIAEIARQLAMIKRGFLNRGKEANALLAQENIVWHLLLQSFATMGKSSGWNGLIGNKENYNELSFEKIKSLPSSDRLSHIKMICGKAKIRMPDQKAGYIERCFDKIEKEGGLSQVRKQLLGLNGRKAKIKYLKSFHGIGEKYSRNMIMDVYHEDFRESIAIDSRIQKISDSWKLVFSDYEQHEKFYLGIAKAAGLNGWELDRLMYRYSVVFENEAYEI